MGDYSIATENCGSSLGQSRGITFFIKHRKRMIMKIEKISLSKHKRRY